MYLDLCDILLNHPTYNEILQQQLTPIYAQTVDYLARNGFEQEVEHAKVIRKLWLGKIHPEVYEGLKREVLKLCGVDIDVLREPEGVIFVRDYYQRVLKMPISDIQFYLPQVTLLPRSDGLERSVKLPESKGVEKVESEVNVSQMLVVKNDPLFPSYEP